MNRKKLTRYAIVGFVFITFGWTVLTLYVEIPGPAKQWTFGTSQRKTALVVYDPDPFYHLDEQVCLALAKAMVNDSITVTVATVAAAQTLDTKTYNVLVYCANTYNWRPDWAITDFIQEYRTRQRTPVVAITLGAGSTESAQRNFEAIIIKSGGRLLGSYSLWLWRPNDETKVGKPNVDVAVAMAAGWGKQIAEEVNE